MECEGSKPTKLWYWAAADAGSCADAKEQKELDWTTLKDGTGPVNHSLGFAQFQAKFRG